MRTIRKTAVLLLALTVLLSALTPAAAAKKKGTDYQINGENKAVFIELLEQMKSACEAPAGEGVEQIDALVEQIAAVNADDGDIARSIAEHWKAVFLDPGYQLCVYEGGETADELAATKPDYGEKHAFVVLGYQLKNGKMQEELKGRCSAAAAAARSFPDSYLICSGGATGPNNPDNNTEAGLMKRYLVYKHGIDKERILIDTRAMTTRANAENTFAILRKHDIHSITIVTSTYHQKWGQALYNALAAIYEQQQGYHARLIGNYCFDTQPSVEVFLKDDWFAIYQLGEILGLPRAQMKELPNVYALLGQ